MHVTFSSKYFNCISSLDDMGFFRACSLCARYTPFKSHCQCPFWDVRSGEWYETHVIQLTFKVRKQHHRPGEDKDVAKNQEQKERKAEERREKSWGGGGDRLRRRDIPRSAYWHRLRDPAQCKPLLPPLPPPQVKESVQDSRGTHRFATTKWASNLSQQATEQQSGCT